MLPQCLTTIFLNGPIPDAKPNLTLRIDHLKLNQVTNVIVAPESNPWPSSASSLLLMVARAKISSAFGLVELYMNMEVCLAFGLAA